MYWLLIFALLCPSVASAAYLDPIVISKEPRTDGVVKLVLEFAGNAGEPTVRRDYLISSSTTATIFRNWAYTTKQELDKLYTAMTLPSLQKGQTVPALAPSAPPAPTALDVWVGKANKLRTMKEMQAAGVTALDAEIAALAADVNGTYPGGF